MNEIDAHIQSRVFNSASARDKGKKKVEKKKANKRLTATKVQMEEGLSPTTNLRKKVLKVKE